MKKYIISVTHTRIYPGRPKEQQKEVNVTYVSELDDQFSISCSKDIKKAYKFYDYTLAWIVGKIKRESYYFEPGVKIVEVTE